MSMHLAGKRKITAIDKNIINTGFFHSFMCWTGDSPSLLRGPQGVSEKNWGRTGLDHENA